MTIDGGMTEEEDAAMQAANADWKSQAVASEAAIAPASTNRAPLTIGDFDAEDQKRGREWDKSSHLRWVEAVAWIATRSFDDVAVLSAYRAYRSRRSTIYGGVGERASVQILGDAAPASSINRAARDLRALCADGSLPAITQPTGEVVPPIDWHRGDRKSTRLNSSH